MYEQAWWQNKRELALMIVGALFAIVVIVWVVWAHIHKNTPVAVTQQTPANPVAVVPSSELPASFPPNIPLPRGVAVTDNFNAAAANGQFQATRSFKSTNSVAANFAIYQNFLNSTSEKTTWTILNQTTITSSTANASILARESSGLMTITIEALPPQPFPLSLVTITYVTNPPAPAPISSNSAPSSTK